MICLYRMGLVKMLTRRTSHWAVGSQKTWIGILLAGVFRMEGITKMGEHAHGTPYILYQLELSVLLSDCFHMSFQSGAVFCNSHVIRAFPCQEIKNRTLELEFRVYHST